MPVDPNADRNQDLDHTGVLDLRMPGGARLIYGVTDTIAARLVQLTVPEEKQKEIILAVQEALVNAVVHGCKNDCNKEVRCRLRRDPEGRIVIVITDPGRGFRLEDIADP